MTTRTLLRRLAVPTVLLAALLAARPAGAQMPRINTLFPIGGKAGSTVEVEVRGSGLQGANQLISDRPGVTAAIDPGAAKIDETGKPIWQSKCAGCHELRGPNNRSMTPAQWAATVERMVKVRQAPLSSAEAEKVTAYLTSAARAGKVTAQVKIAADVQPGLYELRVMTPRGVSTACPFEVGNLPEVTGASGTRETAQGVTLPCVANGSLIGNAERHYFKFAVKKGQRIVCNLKAFRYNEQTQMFFYPDLRLYDAQGKELVENHGYYELDPLIDWTSPADGEYTLEVRDLLGRGNPGNVYRMVMGAVPYDTVLYPPAGQVNRSVRLAVVGKNVEGATTTASMTAPDRPGIAMVSSPVGPQPIYVTPYAVVSAGMHAGQPTALPASFAGRILKAGNEDSFYVTGDGVYEFEGFAERIGSPARLRVGLLNSDGRQLAGFNGDERAVQKLEKGKTYTLKVGDTSGSVGPECVYLVEARPATAYVQCVVRPSNVTVRPGMATAVEVVLNRRERVDGDIQLSVEGLPAGVTASPAVIQPDRGSAWILLTAAPGAAPSEAPIQIYATANGPLGQGRWRAQPQEEFRLNNDQRFVDRTECVLAVRGPADFTGSVDTGGPVKLHPRKGVDIKVRIQRTDSFKGNVTFRVVGLPGGWVASPETIGGDKQEATLTLRPDGGNTEPFLKRDPKLTPIRAAVIAEADEFPFVIGTFEVGRAENIEPDDRR